MKIRSLFFSVIFIALFSLVAIIALFSIFVHENSKKHYDLAFEHYQVIRSILLYNNSASDDEIDRLMAQFSMVIIHDIARKNAIVQGATVMKEDKRKLVTRTLFPAPAMIFAQQELDLDVALLEYEKRIYFYLHTPFGEMIIEDASLAPFDYFLALLPLFSMVLLQVGVFTFILAKLFPLRQIAQTLARFGQGDMSVRLHISGNNEIAEVAEAFNHAVMQIEKLIENRTLFIRNVMHELKTPIAKGRILTQKLPAEQQGRMDALFIRLQSLLDDFALIDQVNSFVNIDKTKRYSYEDLLDEAIDLLMIGKEETNIEVKHDKIEKVDFTLFVIVFKNLLDNALKYGKGEKISIIIDEKGIDFVSHGAALARPLNEYMEAFVGEKVKHSFGLGLYIVKSILDKHDKHLEYWHAEGTNHFKVIDNSSTLSQN